MKHPIKEIIEKRQLNIPVGIASFCTANSLVIETILENANRFGDYVLIESTANQVNQYGGYANMTPFEFAKYIFDIADKVNFPKDKIILGGDHLGPLAWVDKPEKEAMENACELVRQAVLAGYTKIHLDTSMRVGDDSLNEKLSDEVIARRGAILYEVCEKAFKERYNKYPDSMHPIYIIGSEVPIPGGIQDETDSLEITKPSDLENTIKVYKKELNKLGFGENLDNIVAIVVQPGVEFGNDDLHIYDRLAAKNLSKSLKKYPNIVFEGHSTDYQSKFKLKEMVEDGVAILKVGPALTFALREALFSLSLMENDLIEDEMKKSHFIEILDEVMLNNPKDWKKYYFGSDDDIKLARKYSFSDRSRYYLSNNKIEQAISILFKNIDSCHVPLGMIKQHFPEAFEKIRDGTISKSSKNLVKSHIEEVIEDYNFAVKYNYKL